jgi:hypothetical protein
MKEGDPNLASNWSFLTRGGRSSFLPDFPDKHLPRLSTSPGGNDVRRSSPLGGQLCGAGLDLHDTFRRRRCVFAKENHRGNWREPEDRSIIILGLWAILLLQKEKNGIRKIQ